ncbi:TetR/AcrR family transcriptional regulator [Marinobacter orientalis]|uniref:TetR/AcrR family transcriptional regulator n=1 Tax=Marinobacter orientalis TaxID=1928859 RepID=A0A7Y0NLC4_9GAMM|nr:TetR/AcrR family transcriptional regulator [Marinobacter orientalis]NMT62871.1 TetR/AcrR family transcriptional regulator [Marinobacter orientalis]TGX51546.1 TetR/AcrR family transcriptional regulator [Marinobacter orientalis]
MARNARYDRQIALEKAMNLFWEKGYAGASMKQIELALDMRPGSIYATFGSKDGLFREALAAYAERGGAELREHLAGYESILDGLQEYLRRTARQSRPGTETPSRACMIVKTLLEASYTNTVVADQANTILHAIEQSLRELLEQAKTRGELVAGTDCARLARLLQAQLIGLRSFAQRDIEPEQVTDLAEDMASILDQYRVRH